MGGGVAGCGLPGAGGVLVHQLSSMGSAPPEPKLRATLALPGGPAAMDRFFCVAFSPDSKTLASGYDCEGFGYPGYPGEQIKLWDLATGMEKATFDCPYWRGARSVAFSPDGKTLASGSGDDDDQAVGRGDGQGAGHLQGTHRCYGVSSDSVAYSPDGKTLASGSWDPRRREYDQAVGRGDGQGTGHPQGTQVTGVLRGVQSGRQDAGLGER